MPDSEKLPFSFAMNINTQDESTGVKSQEKSDEAFCIAMMGDFSGKGKSSGGRFIEIDRYNYDEVLASMAIQLLPGLDDNSDGVVDVHIRSLKDFHPDKLYQNVDVFGQLRDLRTRMSNTETFKQALEEIGIQEEAADAAMQEQAVVATQSPVEEQSVDDRAHEESPGGLLDSILDATENQAGHGGDTAQTAAQPAPGRKSLVDAFIQQAISGRKTVSHDPRQDDMIAAVDEAITEQMRSLLHHPHFQAMESAWRAVHFMVKRIRSGKAVKLYLLDVSRSELANDLASDDVTQTQLYKQFCDSPVGDIRWSLIIGNYRFAASIDDMLLLSQMGAIAQQAGARFIAAADETLVGCESFAKTPKAEYWQYEISPQVRQAWALMRKSPVAKSISLALPRFLLRQPYGSKATPLKMFAFEEMSDRPEHENFLWGNPAFLKAEQIARAFMENGWQMHMASVLDTEDLPVYYYEERGQTMVKPCAEIPLTDSGASKMIAQGLIPLWSVKNADRIHSGDFHSIVE